MRENPQLRQSKGAKAVILNSIKGICLMQIKVCRIRAA